MSVTREVFSPSAGVRCAADLYLPGGGDGYLPCVVMGQRGHAYGAEPPAVRPQPRIKMYRFAIHPARRSALGLRCVAGISV